MNAYNNKLNIGAIKVEAIPDYKLISADANEANMLNEDFFQSLTNSAYYRNNTRVEDFFFYI